MQDHKHPFDYIIFDVFAGSDCEDDKADRAGEAAAAAIGPQSAHAVAKSSLTTLSTTTNQHTKIVVGPPNRVLDLDGPRDSTKVQVRKSTRLGSLAFSFDRHGRITKMHWKLLRLSTAQSEIGTAYAYLIFDVILLFSNSICITEVASIHQLVWWRRQPRRDGDNSTGKERMLFLISNP